MPGIPHPIPTFPQFFPFYPQIGGLYSLTLLPLDRLESRPTFIHYPSSPLSSVLCSDSFIRSPFVDDLPPDWKACPAVVRSSRSAVCSPSVAPPSAVCPDSFIRSPFVDGLPPQTEKPVLLSSALLDQPSARRLSPRRPCSAPIRLFVPHSLTVSPQTEKPALLSSALLSQPSARRLSPSVPRCPRSTIHRPPCRPCSAPIRLFVPHSLTVCPLTGRKARPTAVCCLPSAVSIRLFVPHSLTVCPLTGRKARPTAVCCLPSAVSIRLFVPRFVDGLPPDEPESPSYRGLPSAVRRLSHSVRPSTRSGVV
jgi:hypothetical protein